MIRKLPNQRRWRLYSKQPDARTGLRRNLGTFSTYKAAAKHEGQVMWFKKHK